MPLDLSRRRFFGFLAAPAIVRASSLMPISVFAEDNLLLSIETRWAPGHPVFNPAAIWGTYPDLPRQWELVFREGMA